MQIKLIELEKDIIDFLGRDGIEYLNDFKKRDNFALAFGSMLYGGIGMQVRNYLRSKYPNFLDNFKDYEEFEDWSNDIVLDILDNYGN